MQQTSYNLKPEDQCDSILDSFPPSSLLPPPDLSLRLHHNSPSVLWHFLAYPLCSLLALWEQTTRPSSSEVKAGWQPAFKHWLCWWRKRSIHSAVWVWETLWCLRLTDDDIKTHRRSLYWKRACPKERRMKATFYCSSNSVTAEVTYGIWSVYTLFNTDNKLCSNDDIQYDSQERISNSNLKYEGIGHTF